MKSTTDAMVKPVVVLNVVEAVSMIVSIDFELADSGYLYAVPPDGSLAEDLAI